MRAESAELLHQHRSTGHPPRRNAPLHSDCRHTESRRAAMFCALRLFKRLRRRATCSASRRRCCSAFRVGAHHRGRDSMRLGIATESSIADSCPSGPCSRSRFWGLTPMGSNADPARAGSSPKDYGTVAERGVRRMLPACSAPISGASRTCAVGGSTASRSSS
jgi:hypothetical protein